MLVNLTIVALMPTRYTLNSNHSHTVTHGDTMKIGTTVITLADVCMVVIAVFVVLAYFHGWG
jgi:hypothetical protein